MKINSRIELLNLESRDGKEIISFPPLSDEEIDIINPIVPPTSGIRMKIYEKHNSTYLMTKRAQFMFLRVFKAVSEISEAEIDLTGLPIKGAKSIFGIRIIISKNPNKLTLNCVNCASIYIENYTCKSCGTIF